MAGTVPSSASTVDLCLSLLEVPYAADSGENSIVTIVNGKPSPVYLEGFTSVLPAPSSWMTGDIYVQILRIVLFRSPFARVATTLGRVSCLLSGNAALRLRIEPELCNPRRLARPTQAQAHTLRRGRLHPVHHLPR